MINKYKRCLITIITVLITQAAIRIRLATHTSTFVAVTMIASAPNNAVINMGKPITLLIVVIVTLIREHKCVTIVAATNLFHQT